MMKIAAALPLLLALGGSPLAAQDVTAGEMIFNGINRGGTSTVSITPGLVTLAGKIVTVAVPALKVGDAVVVQPYSGSLALGVGIGAARVPADGQLEINLVNTVAVGVSVSTITVQVLYFGQ